MKKKKYTTRSKEDKNDFAIFEISPFPHQLHTNIYTHAYTNHTNHSSEPFNFVPPSFIPFSHIMTNRTVLCIRSEQTRRIEFKHPFKKRKRKKKKTSKSRSNAISRRKLPSRCKQNERAKRENHSLLISRSTLANRAIHLREK